MPAADYVALDVKDDGVGMSADTVTKAFDPFFTAKPIWVGTGLGLSILAAIRRPRSYDVNVG